MTTLISAAIEPLLTFLGKILALLFIRQSGKDSAKKEILEETLHDIIEERTKDEDEAGKPYIVHNPAVGLR